MIRHQKIDTKKWCKLMFGDYAEVHEANTITNSLNPRTRPVMCMGPTGNIQGLIKCMCIETGKKIVRRSCTRLPMPDSIIRKVEMLAERASTENGIVLQNSKKKL